jgi:hypothetical protein
MAAYEGGSGVASFLDATLFPGYFSDLRGWCKADAAPLQPRGDVVTAQPSTRTAQAADPFGIRVGAVENPFCNQVAVGIEDPKRAPVFP